MELRAFTVADYATLISWIDDAKLNYLWGGPRFTFPLDHAQLEQHCAQAEVISFMFDIAGKPAGYVELVRKSKSHLRICRVFVSPAFRGQGMAKIMLNQLMALAINQYGASQLSLAVFERNKVAKNCYETLGFKVISHEKGTRAFAGETWDLLLMEKRLE